jgi:hypothetical protein
VLPAASPKIVAPQDRQLPEKGIKYYWKNRNNKSIDGLPGMESAYASEQRPGQYHESGQAYIGLVDDESEKVKKSPAKQSNKAAAGGSVAAEASREQVGLDKAALGFGAGVLAGIVLSRWLR